MSNCISDYRFFCFRLNICCCVFFLYSLDPVFIFCHQRVKCVKCLYCLFLAVVGKQNKLWGYFVLIQFNKFQYEYSQHPLSGQALSLVRIVLNTIENHYHRCRKVDDPTMCAASSAYSRGKFLHPMIMIILSHTKYSNPLILNLT